VPYKVRQFVPTPNPNAIKCVVEPSPAPDGPRSYGAGDQATGDALASALFAIEGVSNLLIHDGWITVNKRPDAEWKRVKAAIERTLESAE
jgi:hypothetical protein